MEMSSDIAAKRYAIIFAIPISAVLLAGVVEPLVDGFFLLISFVVVILLVIGLVLHKRFFSFTVGADDPIPESALSGYLVPATGFFAIAIVLLSFDRTLIPNDFLETNHSWGPLLGAVLIGGEVSSILLWLAVLPTAGAVSFNYLRRRRQLVRSAAIIASALLVGALCLLAARNQLGRTVASLSFQTLTLLQLLILFSSGLVAVAVFFVVLRISEDVLKRLHKDLHAWLLLPTGLGIADLITIVQGLNGLHEHYSFFVGIAFGGMIALILSLLSGLAFGGVCVVRGLSRRNTAHYLLAFSMSLFLGCLTMYTLAEAGGFWFKSLR